MRKNKLLGSKEGGKEDELLGGEEGKDLLGGRDVKVVAMRTTRFLAASGMMSFLAAGGRRSPSSRRRMTRLLAARSSMRTGGKPTVQCWCSAVFFCSNVTSN